MPILIFLLLSASIARSEAFSMFCDFNYRSFSSMDHSVQIVIREFILNHILVSIVNWASSCRSLLRHFDNSGFPLHHDARRDCVH